MVVTTNGRNDVRALTVSAVADKYKWFGVGSDNTAEDSSQTDLISPIEVWHGSGIYRKEVETVYWDGENIVFVCRLGQAEFNGSGSTTINEIGIFSAQSGGTMLVREVLNTSLTKDDNKEYVLAVKVALFG